MTTHHIKLKEQFCDAVLSGEKPFEIRRNDRCYQKGDHIRFVPIKNFSVEWFSSTIPFDHPIKDKEYEITYIFSGWIIPRDYVVLGIKEVQNNE